ncbi:MAG: hypothetical protein CMC18_00050 [Flavobacteriaceae bacterium]|nr:hypothetical protein [Flavobacteriaceae bacterium]
MRILLFNLCCLAFVFSTRAHTNSKNWDGKYTETKVISKTFEVEKTALLDIKNKYGNIVFTSWDQNEIHIEVKMKANGNNLEKVKSELEAIEIHFESSSTKVLAHTDLSTLEKRFWGRKSVDIEINYTVKLPIKASVKLDNRYGSIKGDRIDGYARINCDYGSVSIEELRGRNNKIELDYCNSSYFGFINSAFVDADYSKVEIDRSNRIELNTDYSNTQFGNVIELDYDIDYGGLEIEEAGEVHGISDYAGIRIDYLFESLVADSDFGSIKIMDTDPEASEIKINSDYTGIKIGVNAQWDFNFEFDGSYGEVKGKDLLNLTQVVQKNRSKSYKGYYLDESSSNLIRISMDYGGLRLEKTSN